MSLLNANPFSNGASPLHTPYAKLQIYICFYLQKWCYIGVDVLGCNFWGSQGPCNGEGWLSSTYSAFCAHYVQRLSM